MGSIIGAAILVLAGVIAIIIGVSYARKGRTSVAKSITAQETINQAEKNRGRNSSYPEYDSQSTSDRKRYDYEATAYKRTSLILKSIGSAMIVFAAIILVVASTVTVPTKQFGVLLSFNRPVGMLTNGLHWKAPWETVTELDAAIQTDNYTGNNCINVRIARQSTMCVNASVSWRIKDTAVDSLFQNYRDFDNIKTNLVTRQLSKALITTFEGYDPLAVDKDGLSTEPQMSTYSTRVTTELQKLIGEQITVNNIVLYTPKLDTTTETKLNQIQAQIAQTKVADQQILTNQKLAEANKILSQSISNDPNVLVSQCLTMIQDGKATNLPAGFSCWPGNGSSVVVPSAAK